jgi:hypothetical protein
MQTIGVVLGYFWYKYDKSGGITTVANTDVYAVTLFGEIRQQQTVNVFTYRQFGTEVGDLRSAEGLAQEFEQLMFATNSPLRGTQIISSMLWRGLRVQNLFDDTDYAESAFGTPYSGSAVGDGLPPFATYSLRTPWLGGAVRRGFKRISGVPEASQGSGIITTNAQTAMNALGVLFGTNIEYEGAIYAPVVVKRVKYIHPKSGRAVYRMPESLGETYAVAAPQWTVSPEVSTQNSRKVDRGS